MSPLSLLRIKLSCANEFSLIAGKEKHASAKKKQAKQYDEIPPKLKTEGKPTVHKGKKKDGYKTNKSNKSQFSKLDSEKSKHQFVPKQKANKKDKKFVTKQKDSKATFKVENNNNKEGVKKKSKHKKKRKKLSAERKQELLRRVTLDEFGPLTEFDFSVESVSEVEPTEELVEEVSKWTWNISHASDRTSISAVLFSL